MKELNKGCVLILAETPGFSVFNGIREEKVPPSQFKASLIGSVREDGPSV